MFPDKLASHRGLSAKVRLHELDGLRVAVFGLLILYHTGMLYVAGWDWHYKSQYKSEILANVMLWSNQWRMSLLFFISGAALALFFSTSSGWQATAKRLSYILLPLLFGMLVVVVPQVYIEAKSKHIIEHLDYWDFWYAYLDQTSAEFANHKTLGQLHLTWNHLWYLPYLLIYSLIAALGYPLLRCKFAQQAWCWLVPRITLWQVILIPILGFYINGAFLYEDHPVTHNLVEDWFNHGRSFLSFALGFSLVKIPRLWHSLKNHSWHLLIIAAASYVYTLFSYNGGSLGDGKFLQEFNGFLWSANSWLWILCATAWGQKWFTQGHWFIRYLNVRIFCFYVLHQTLIILFAYWLTPLKLGAVLEPTIVIIFVALSCWMSFEVIKRVPGLRIFFGIRARKNDGRIY
jgi:glucan biosynthesis protein C